MFFFFFKQKTAYEMRISDWSSDVCSSDLAVFVETREIGDGIATLQQFDDFIEQAGGRNLPQQRRQRANRRGRVLVDPKFQLAGDADRTQHAYRIFAIAQLRIANHADHAGLDVLDRKSTSLNSSH